MNVNDFEDEDDNLGGTSGFKFKNNFAATDVEEDEIILAVLTVDVSPSVNRFKRELNEAFSEFIITMQNSHVAKRLMVAVVEFNENVIHRTGFQFVKTLDTSSFTFEPRGYSTALYDAMYESVSGLIAYRDDLESSGVTVKCFMFGITDGKDEGSTKHRPTAVKELIAAQLQSERTAFSFETILLGIGDEDELKRLKAAGIPSEFEKSQKAMGIAHLAEAGTTAKEIRKLIGFISASVSSGQVVQF